MIFENFEFLVISVIDIRLYKWFSVLFIFFFNVCKAVDMSFSFLNLVRLVFVVSFLLICRVLLGAKNAGNKTTREKVKFI